MRYLICKEQYGEGCDYTIGCGMVFEFVEAESVDDAIEMTIYPDGGDSYCALEGDEMALATILVIPAEHVITVDIKRMLKKIKRQRKQEEKEEKRQQELVELKRLIEKHGDSLLEMSYGHVNNIDTFFNGSTTGICPEKQKEQKKDKHESWGPSASIYGLGHPMIKDK